MKCLLLLFLIADTAFAQSVPNGTISQGQVWTPTQWNTAWQSKIDYNIGTNTGIGTNIGQIPQWINFQSSGIAGLNASGELVFGRATTGAVDAFNILMLRASNYTGGTNGNVNTALGVETTNSAGTKAYEWNALFKMDNFGTSTDGSSDLALYGQTFKESSGKSWASVFELRDFTQDPPPGSAVTTEFDLWANDTDANVGRIIIDVVGGKRPGGDGVTPTINYGIRIGPQFNTNTNVNFVTPLYIYGSAQQAFNTAIAGINISGTPTLWLDSSTGLTTGINLGGSYSGNAIQSTGFSVSGSGAIAGTTLGGTTITASTEVLAPIGCPGGYNFTTKTTSGMCYSTGLLALQNQGVSGITIGTVGQVTLTGVLTAPAGMIVSGAASTINFNSNFSTGINTGTSTGAIQIGNSGTTGVTSLLGISTGTNADFLCLSSAGVVLLQASACTISSEKFKTNIELLQDASPILKLHVDSYSMKQTEIPNRDPNFTHKQIGLLAEEVAEIAPECAIYENDMKTPKSYRPECITALGVKVLQDHQRVITRQQYEIYVLGLWCALLTVCCIRVRR